LVTVWPELNMEVSSEIPDPKDCDAVVFAVPHTEYQNLDLSRWLGGARPLVLDANAVLSHSQRQTLLDMRCPIAAIGRGD
jgi:hypothetical protein